MLKKLVVTLLISLMLAAGSAWANEIDGLASSQQAAPVNLGDLYVNPGGLGDALIYGYYNARNAVTFIRIVNTDVVEGVIGKLVFRAGDNSEEVLDFIICLSPGDEWSGWILDPATFGLPNGPAILVRGGNAYGIPADDDTITVPGTWSEVAFRHGATGADPSVTIDDTKEGYFHFIATAGVDNFHSAITTSEECSLEALSGGDGDAPNSLMGSAYIFDLRGAFIPTFAYNASALANFLVQPYAGLNTGDINPTFSEASAGLNAVNYVLTKSNLYTLYDLEAWLSGNSDMIVTFPTKKDTTIDETVCLPYFQLSDDERCCAPVAVTIWNDEEDKNILETDFSPQIIPEMSLCNEVNYVQIGNSPILDTSLNELVIGTMGFDIGWMRMHFNIGSTTVDNHTLAGAPVIGYQLEDFVTGAATHMLPLRYDVVAGGAAAVCDIDHLELCLTAADCIGAGGEWCDDDNDGVFQCQLTCAGGAPTTVINGETVDCNTDCTALFPGNIPAIVQCEAWQDATCTP